MERERLFLQPLTKQANKFLSKQDANTRERIIRSIEKLQWFPPQADIRPMSGSDDEYRMRVGKIRIIYQMDYYNKSILVKTIDSRGDIYK